MSKTNSGIFDDWFTRPDPEHAVHFYTSGNQLVNSLEQYIGSGLRAGDICIIIATDEHITGLNNQLRQTVNVDSLQNSGQYITLDANETLELFMVDDVPDEKLFMKSVGQVIANASKVGKPIRAYGEMVAELWKQGNEAGVMELEQLWNRLAKNYQFSLYCAYPDMHFIMDAEAKKNIHACHNLNFSGCGV